MYLLLAYHGITKLSEEFENNTKTIKCSLLIYDVTTNVHPC